ncbi:chitin deacetylase [Steccherinum ochraceum]|uniref:chitin deacetylase n=1 Tax=Steccherinum ochraceum TaxID=92696 RepID=A0A4R0S2J9_9APHY|nr:chitin deacetylase [Steccherinum ochraceum]
MKVVALAAITVPLLAAAHKPNLLPRQASPPPSAATGASSAAATGSTSSLPSVSWSLAATNPTAAPLSIITQGTLTTSATLPLTTTQPAGAKPTYLSNAPPLPDLSTVSPANYPALDKSPPTDSPEVQAWIAEVNASGITIPNIAPTVAGGCAANAQAAADQSRCWWTCGGCVRDTDITTCPDKLTWGLTHDDGPAPYTPNLLQYLAQVNLSTTFFNVGSRVISYPNTIRDAYMAGNQVAVHTWSHPQMTTLTNEEIIAELGWTRKVMRDVLGVTPLYWRPPYGDIDDRVRAIGQAMNLIPVMWTRLSPTVTFDTGDFNVAGGLDSATEVLANWQFIVGNATTINTGFIVLEHDLFIQTVEIATGYILPAALANNPPLKIQPVITCMHKDFSAAYLETNDNKTNPIPNPKEGQAIPSSGGNSSSSGGGAQAGGSGSGASQSGSDAMALDVPSSSGLFALAGSAVLGLFAAFA